MQFGAVDRKLCWYTHFCDSFLYMQKDIENTHIQWDTYEIELKKNC